MWAQRKLDYFALEANWYGLRSVYENIFGTFLKLRLYSLNGYQPFCSKVNHFCVIWDQKYGKLISTALYTAVFENLLVILKFWLTSSKAWILLNSELSILSGFWKTLFKFGTLYEIETYHHEYGNVSWQLSVTRGETSHSVRDGSWYPVTSGVIFSTYDFWIRYKSERETSMSNCFFIKVY